MRNFLFLHTLRAGTYLLLDTERDWGSLFGAAEKWSVVICRKLDDDDELMLNVRRCQLTY